MLEVESAIYQSIRAFGSAEGKPAPALQPCTSVKPNFPVEGSSEDLEALQEGQGGCLALALGTG